MVKFLDVVIRVRISREEKEELEKWIGEYNLLCGYPYPYDISKLVRDCLRCFLRDANCKVKRVLEEQKGKSKNKSGGGL